MTRQQYEDAQRIADSPASTVQILDAANYYLSLEGDEHTAWSYREAIAIRLIDHPNTSERGGG